MDIDMDGPLSEDEIQVLDDFLMSDAVPEDCMDLSMLDGFLTALAIGPTTLPPSRWLPEIWGGEMAWASEAQARRITTLIFRHANALLFFLREEPESFEPLLWEAEQEGRPVAILDEWCTGFVRGMFLDDDAWQPLLDTEEGEEMLYPIMLYGTEGGWEELQDNPELAARHAEFAALLGESVAAIQAWWLPRRKAASTLRRDEAKVGRNDLCPCGSGKKFKKCCGAPERLH